MPTSYFGFFGGFAGFLASAGVPSAASASATSAQILVPLPNRIANKNGAAADSLRGYFS